MIRESNTLEWQETAEQKRMTQRRMIQRRERARRRKRKVWRIRGLLLLFGCLLFLGGVRRFRQNPIQRYAKANGISMDQYPEDLLSLYERNKETETFVEEYPLKKDGEPEIDLSDLSSASEVPLLLQWDQRWGYREYGDGIIGITGCGPTCLSMVYIYLTGDTSMNPYQMAQYSQSSGYYVNGTGTSWELMGNGASNLGLDAVQIPLDEDRIIANLEAGNPVICSMGPGKFTKTGHFIVLTEYENGKFKVNDPNSKQRSRHKWSYEDIAESVLNIWVYRNK